MSYLTLRGSNNLTNEDITMSSLSTDQIDRYLKGGKERKKIASDIAREKFGDLKTAFEAICDIQLPNGQRIATQQMDTCFGYYTVQYGSDDSTFNIKHVDDGFVGAKGNILNCIGAFFGYRDLEAYIKGKEVFEGFFKIPMWLVSDKKRQLGEEYLISQYGDMLSAGLAITGLTLYKCPVKTKQNRDQTGGYRLLDDKGGSFKVIHVNSGDCGSGADIYSNIGMCLCGDWGQATSVGWEAVYNDAIGKGSNFQMSDDVRKKLAEERAQREADEKAKFEQNHADAIELYQRRIDTDEGHRIYSEVIQKGRGQAHFEGVELSDSIGVVHDVPYYCKGDDKNNGRLMTAVVFPLVVKENNEFKVKALHLLYIEKIGGVWSKANVDMAKQDFGKWGDNRGSLTNIAVSNSGVLYAGEGNETVASYCGAVVERYGILPGTFKASHTASRLTSSGLSCSEYKQVKLLVDRDRSGTGIASCMKLRAELEDKDIEVDLIMPPSCKVPIYIYVNDSHDATNLQSCIEECAFWREVDSDFRNGWGQQYSSRYEAFVVIPEKYRGDISNVNYPHIIHESEIDKKVIPKGVDWDDALKFESSLAFELEDFYDQEEAA